VAASVSRLARVAIPILELATLFVACLWGFEQSVFAGIIAPLLVGLVWRRMINPRFSGRVVVPRNPG
jgi:hypothetical protein